MRKAVVCIYYKEVSNIMHDNLIIKRIRYNNRRERLGGLIDSLKELANQGKDKIVNFLKDKSPDAYNVISTWSDDIKNTFSDGLKKLTETLQNLKTYYDNLPPNEQTTVQDMIDEILEPLLGPNAFELGMGLLAVTQAIVKMYNTGVPPQTFTDICTELNTLIQNMSNKLT